MELARAAEQHAEFQQAAADKTAQCTGALLRGSASFPRSHTQTEQSPTTAPQGRKPAACLYFDMVFLAGPSLSDAAAMLLGEPSNRSCTDTIVKTRPASCWA